MKKLLPALCLVLVLMASCRRAQQAQDTLPAEVTIDLQASTTQDAAALTDLLQDVECIPLETSLPALLTRIVRIEPFEGNYYILDGEKKCILVFDKEGKLLRSLGAVGKGHGEYLSVADFAIDRERRRVAILGGMANLSQAYVYDLDGKFLFSKKLDESPLWSLAGGRNGFLATTNHFTYTEGENAFLFYYFDKDFNFLHKHTPVLPKQMHHLGVIAARLKTEQDRFVYSDTYTRQTYLLNDSGQIVQRLKYTMSNPMPYEAYDNFMKAQYEYSHIDEETVAGDRVVTYYMQRPEGPRIAVADRSTGEVLLNAPYAGIVPHFHATDDRRTLCAFSAEEFAKLAEQARPGQAFPAVKPGDNHVLLWAGINQ